MKAVIGEITPSHAMSCQGGLLHRFRSILISKTIVVVSGLRCIVLKQYMGIERDYRAQYDLKAFGRFGSLVIIKTNSLFTVGHALAFIIASLSSEQESEDDLWFPGSRKPLRLHGYLCKMNRKIMVEMYGFSSLLTRHIIIQIHPHGLSKS